MKGIHILSKKSVTHSVQDRSRIFLDVGGNRGQTITMVLQPQFRIDKVISFDPSPICYTYLMQKFGDNPKVTIVPKGLWKRTCQLDLHNEGSEGGTILKDYRTTCRPVPRITKCNFVRASEWFAKNISKNDDVFLKLNCEGSECDIVLDLLASGEYEKITATLIDFDVRKSPSSVHMEQVLKAEFSKRGITNLHTFMGIHRFDAMNQVLL